MKVIIPALAPDPADLRAVLTAVHGAELTPVVVWQPRSRTPIEDSTLDLLEATSWAPGLSGIVTSHPLGKGGALKAALGSVVGEPFLLLDADLHGIAPIHVATLARNAKDGHWSRLLWQRSGRVGVCVETWLRQFKVAHHTGLTGNGGLLSGAQAYPAAVWDRLDLTDLPEGYGVDLALALDCYDAGMSSRHVHAFLPRTAHRPGDGGHIAHALHHNLDVILDRSSTWSA